jgi:hypothetical protein
MISEVLRTIKSELPKAVKEPFKGNYLADYIRNEGKELINEHIPSKHNTYLCKGSAGMSKWVSDKDAWISAMNPEITTGTSKGYFVVYGFPIKTNYVSLALGQAHEEAQERYGKNWQDALDKLAELRQLDIPKYKDRFDFGADKTGSSNSIHYGTGNIYQKIYDVSNLPDEAELIDDFHMMLDAYDELFKITGAQLDSVSTSEKDINHLQIIQHVLELNGDKGPMHYIDITNEAISNGLLTDYKKTPERSFNRTLNANIKNTFNSHGGGLFSLKNAPSVKKDESLSYRAYSIPKYIENNNKDSLTKSGARKRNLAFNSHKEMEAELAKILLEANIEPHQVSAGPNVDICWKSPTGLNILEVKSLNKNNEDHQLRTGIGQLAEYRNRFKKLGEAIDQCYLCVTDIPKKNLWNEVLNDVGIKLITPENVHEIIKK